MTIFQKLSSDFVPVLQATIEQYLEPISGARHVHMASTQDELVFLVGFPTVPPVSDGRAHILEHLALCGSQRYPVADPFFAMMRRSTATFMNAMTYADRTVYPFASTDKKDFFNLLDVYLDATFFPKLDYLSFRQEGWRHTLKGGKLAYQGVVFNEMKGTFNNPMRALSRGINSKLFKGTTYAADSGGDPLVIPELTHAMLKEFHASHYHPSQAMFLTAGRVDAGEIQAKIIERVLAKASGRSALRMPQLAATWQAPERVDIHVPSQEARADEYGFQLAWLLGETSDQPAAYRAHLLMHGLLGDASAPVMKAMQSAGFGRPSPMNGNDTNARQMVFHLGMEGLTEMQIEAAHALILQTLERTADQGVAVTVLQAALRDLRYGQRQIRGGSMPDGLIRLLNAVPVLMYGGDVLAAFDHDAMLNTLEQQISDPGFFKQLVRDLIDNPTCLVSRVIPDAGFFSKRTAIAVARLAEQEANLTESERRRILEECEALEAQQKMRSNTDVLPRILPGDISPDIRSVPALHQSESGGFSVEIASNGISFADVFYDLSLLPEADWPWLALYADVLSELGVGELSYTQASAWRQSLVPSFRVQFDALYDSVNNQLSPRMVFFASSLREDEAAIARVIQAWIQGARFDEIDRLAFLVKSRIQHKLLNLSQMGDQYAAMAATAPLSAKRRFENIVHGRASLAFCATLQSLLNSPNGMQDIGNTLHRLHACVIASPSAVLCAGQGQDGASLSELLHAPGKVPIKDRATNANRATKAQPLKPENAALVVSSQVNHCVIAWAVPGLNSPDAAALAVAAEFMSKHILHQSLREKGGAYGGFASYAEDGGVFSMSSYRDPRLAETYADFQSALDQILTDDSFPQEALEEAIICVIKRLDKPLSPYSQAQEAWSLRQREISPNLRQQFRHGVLTCSLEKVREVTLRWLKNGVSSRSAAIGRVDQDLAGMRPVDLLSLAG
jgi:Zn-dependent M16 (insulinase) family peptidase